MSYKFLFDRTDMIYRIFNSLTGLYILQIMSVLSKL